jgi:hypothetical protein
MTDDEMRDHIRKILEALIAVEPNVGPFQSAAREELERYRSTFAELAK